MTSGFLMVSQGISRLPKRFKRNVEITRNMLCTMRVSGNHHRNFHLASGLKQPHVWILLLAFYKNITGKNYVALMTTIPSIAIIISLLVSTPAYSEFRYVYSLYCLIPLIVFMALSRPVATQTGKTEDKDEDQMQ